jgi:hypothetical protein
MFQFRHVVAAHFMVFGVLLLCRDANTIPEIPEVWEMSKRFILCSEEESSIITQYP